jgi:site-specific DNA-adenine methylase
MNSTIVLMDELVLLGFEKVIVNDINPCLVQVHFDIRNRPNELIADYLEIIRTKYILKYDGFFLEKEQYEEINSELNEEFMELQRKKEFGIRTSIIFLLLQGIMFSGIPKYDNDKESDDTDFKFSNKIYDMKRYHSVLLNQIPKIRKFSKIYNKIDIEFRNQDFFNLVEEFKNNEEVLFNLDVPYIKEGKEKISDEILSKMTSKDLEDCVINYNQFFDHIKMIKELNNINFIYNNNAHPVLNYYANEFNIKVGNFIRNEVVSSKLNKKTEKVKELILFKNSLLNKSVATNQSSYRPIELVA